MEDLSTFSEAELRMALVEWKRWLDRVYHAKDMSRRQKRFLEARDYIIAIEREIALRSTLGCERLHQQKAVALRQIARDEIVPLDRYRAVHHELHAIDRQIVHHRRSRFEGCT